MTRRPRLALLVDSLMSEYTAQIWRAVERAATARAAEVRIFTGMRVGSPEVIERTQNFIYDKVGPACADGVILVSAALAHYCGQQGLATLRRRFAPLPVCSVGLTLEGVPSLIVDNLGGMQIGVEHLIRAHDCRRIAFIAGHAASPESNLRLEGYRRAHAIHDLAWDPRLLGYGDFTFGSGVQQMERILASGVAFDGVAAANDYMALGALDVLRAHNVQVPREVKVCGFDDIHVASCARPALSSLRQPMWWLGEQAVDAILRQIAGESVPEVSAGAVEYVRRESCGCGEQLELPSRRGRPDDVSLCEALANRREAIAERLRDSVSIPSAAAGDWTTTLLQALERELSDSPGRFAEAFGGLLDAASDRGWSVDEFKRVIGVLRAEVDTLLVTQEEVKRVEALWYTGREFVSTTALRDIGRERMDLHIAMSRLGRTAERFATALSLPLLKKAMSEELPTLMIDRAVVSLYEGQEGILKPLLVLEDGREQTNTAESIRDVELGPTSALTSERLCHWVITPLTFEAEVLGIAMFSTGAIPHIYEALRLQIGSSIKGAVLHRQVVAQVELRERLEQSRISEEARVAAEIQTSMSPSDVRASGLEFAAQMIPAAEAGGDYYDVLPNDSGAWFAIGDVTGHGLASGLIALMIQSMISSLVRTRHDLRPSDVINVVNAAVFDNVRHRLKRDDHATLTVFRYTTDGHLTFSGAHDPFIVYRASTGRCATIEPPGFWVGALENIAHITTDAELRLAPGDLVVLYTDGVTEARNAQQEQYSLERLVELIQAHARRPVRALVDTILENVRAWGSSFDDDMTVVVLRYLGSP